jgi:predicted AAA+ superfamily ATPase
VSLEAPDVRAFATDDPRAFLAQFPKGAVIDEVQRAPDLPSYLQGIIDDDPKPGRWILTGSQNLSLLESVSQSLAGRTAILNLLPLTRSEITRFKRYPKTLDETLLYGGYPRIFDRKLDPSEWLRSYVATYLERDLRTISNV